MCRPARADHARFDNRFPHSMQNRTERGGFFSADPVLFLLNTDFVAKSHLLQAFAPIQQRSEVIMAIKCGRQNLANFQPID